MKTFSLLLKEGSESNEVWSGGLETLKQLCNVTLLWVIEVMITSTGS